MSDGNIKNFTLERAETALLSRDFALAARLYKSVLKDDENNKDVLLKLGTCYVRANQDEKALEPYLKVLSLDKNNFDALNNLGGIYRRLGKYEESVKVLEAALKLGINTGEVNYNLGHTYKQMGHYDAAAESFYSVIDENPNDVLAYNHLGTIQAARGEFKKALQTYWRGLQIDPNHPILHFNSAISFAALEKYDDAINSYENALRTKPGWVEALEGYSALLVQQGNFQKAEEVLNTAIQVTPNNEKLRVQKGNLFFKKRCLTEAEEEYKKAYILNDCNYDTLNGLTKIYETLERYPEATAMLKQLESVSKDKKDIIRRQISLLLFQNKLKEAAYLLKNERKKEPENVEVLNLLAQFFIRSRETKKELGCYRLIKNLDPNYITYLRDCGEQHSKIGNYQQAQNLTAKYLELKPNDTKALSVLGYIAEKREDYEAALKAYQ
ncbi:MAG: tetratricopeptide repeat protein, partial [Spirochaetaceae bacterium]|nr:tetratricopeptide repeat protein [Spirochaetaceae bacterium]